MRYVGIYWSLFALMIKKSIRERFDIALAERSIREGKKEYKRLLSRADELGPGNPMAMNAYFAYVFAAAWLGSGREITPEEMALVMTDVLESKLLRTVFGSFGALNGNLFADEVNFEKDWLSDARRYYCNIVGKYGQQVQAVLAKAGTVPIKMLCPTQKQGRILNQ